MKKINVALLPILVKNSYYYGRKNCILISINTNSFMDSFMDFLLVYRYRIAEHVAVSG